MELVATGPEVFRDEPVLGIRATSLHVDCVSATSTMDCSTPGDLIVDGSDRNTSVEIPSVWVEFVSSTLLGCGYRPPQRPVAYWSYFE